MNTFNSEVREDVRYAGFWVRVMATVLDGFILGIPITILVSLLYGWTWLVEGPGQADLVYCLLSALVTVAFWVNWNGRTPGKKLMGIRLVRHPDLGGITHGKGLLRYVIGYTVSTIVFGLGFVMVAFRDDKRGLHDLIAGTAVIYDR